jgi:NAD(P)-dependent dehydrogenase (short-subunit alcohol dehydrogenase family)
MYNNYFLNKITLVTGAGSGIGRGLCLKLAEAGATVICTDIDPSKAAQTVSLTGQPIKAVAIKLDVTQLAEVESVMAGIISRYGRIDLVFNNAGIAISGEMRDISMEDWKKVIDINFTVCYTVRKLLTCICLSKVTDKSSTLPREQG